MELGSTLRFSAKLYDKDPNEGGILINPTAATLTISLDGVSIATPAITVPPAVTGTFTNDYPTTLPGRYVGRWLFTIAGGKTAAYSQTFNVSVLDPGLLISLSEAKHHLNIPFDDTSSDSELLEWLEGLTPVIENKVGACIPRTVVEYKMSSGYGTVVLRTDETPVLSVTSIVPYLSSGITYTAGQVRCTPDGAIRLLTGLPFTWGSYEITYVVGRKPLPANIGLAVRIILQHLWDTQRGSSGLPLQGGDDVSVIPGLGYAVPNRALELLRPHRRGPSIG
jgi:hypothetical protein